MKTLRFLVFLFFLPSALYSQQIVIPNKKWEGTYLGNPNQYFQAKFRANSEIIAGIEYYELMTKWQAAGLRV